MPPNTTATVYVPAKDAAAVTEGNQPAARAEGVRFLRMEAGSAVYSVGSGTYAFSASHKGRGASAKTTEPTRTAHRWASEPKVRVTVESCRRGALDRAIGRTAKRVTGAADGIDAVMTGLSRRRNSSRVI